MGVFYKQKQGYMMNRALLISGKRERTTLEKIEKFIFPEPNTGCWIWAGALTHYGYGNTKKMTIDGHTLRGAHRIMYYLTYGCFNYKLYVCHKCDNPFCVNPSHMFLATTQGNTEDMRIKGRASKGIHRPTSKLTEAQVLEIREKYKNGGYTHRSLGIEYGIDYGGIRGIIIRQTWKHI